MIEYTIFCDVCGDMIDSDSRSARQARKRAKAKNLLVRILRKDFCPKCAEKHHDETEEIGDEKAIIPKTANYQR